MNRKQQKTIIRNRNRIALAALVILCVCIVALCVLMRGTTDVSGQFPNNIESISMVCFNSDIHYPVFRRRTENGEAKINIIFSNDHPSSISLVYSISTKSDVDATAAETVSHADMNISFAGNGLPPDSYSANYSKLSDKMQMSLFASGTDINQTAAKYFFIDASSGEMPQSIDEYYRNYESKNFTCSKN